MARLNFGIPRWSLAPLARRRRRQVVDRFLAWMCPIPDRATLLDVGGPGLATVLLAPYFKTVVAVNLDPEALSPSHIADPESFVRIMGDGCILPLRDKSVDLVLCDNVIEHVREQAREGLISELRRVSKNGFFITTPNYWFPFEPHYHMPLFQFLPLHWRESLLRRASFGWVSDPNEFIRLLSRRDLQRLLPEATVNGIGFTPFPETLVAWWRQ
jgi:ubiquinone/menaquinone biosynthesis C-methylase UbiE